MEKPNKVLIVDDQNMSRTLFETFVSSSPDFELVAALDSALIADVYCARYHVDLILMDVVMNDGFSGLDAAERIKKTYPNIKIIIVTSMPEVSYIDRAKSIGVDSFWYKEAGDVSLLSVMNKTMEGENIYPDSTPNIKIGLARSNDFTMAEYAVLRELTTGASNQEISDRLFISVNTVRVHIQHMLEKTGFTNRTELAIEARISGIVIAEKRS